MPPEISEPSAQARSLQAEVLGFQPRHKRSRVVVTPLLVAACVGIYLAMLVAGVSPIEPGNESMLAWGADFGPSVAFDHEYWRLITSIFLHFGLIHLALNMWCLISAGPGIERLFGSPSFAALYLLSGVGGSVASIWVHPTVICAGASGAIFGIIGGLLGYLAVRHRDVPAAILKPMRSGATAFVGYNLLFGMTDPKIDMSAHLGGLVTGLVVGLLMMLTPSRSAGPAGSVRRLGVVATLTIVLGLLAWQGIEIAPGRIFADPKVGPIFRGTMIFGPEWNEFINAARPVLAEFDEINSAIDRIGKDIDRGGFPAGQLVREVDSQLTRLDSVGSRIGSIPARNFEIREVRDQMTHARAHQRAALDALKRFIASGEEGHINGKDGFSPSIEAYNKDFERIGTLRDAYFKAHGLSHEVK